MTPPPYPIADQRTLQETPKRGPLGLRGRRREYDELPQTRAHQVLVYRVGGEYLVDNGRRGLQDDQVVEATHVSLVDMSRNMPVRVELAIPSTEASEFTVQVTFVCTVTDAVTVVREGQHDAGISLLNYLRSHHRIFELGLDHNMSAINTVRRDVKAQVEAYTQLKPPMIPGMSISMASVEVLTPEELIDFHKTLRGQERDHKIAFGLQQYGHKLERAQEDNEQALEQIRKQHAQELERQRQKFDQMLAQQRRSFAQVELTEVSHSIGNDPLKAAVYAHVKGELTTTDLAAQLQAAKDREEDETKVRAQQDREDRMRELEWMRTEVQRREALEREDHLRELDWTRTESQQDREDRMRKEEWTRTDALGRESAQREDRLHALNVRLDVLKEVAKHGHLDEIHVDVERLIGTLVTGTENNYKADTSALQASREQLPAPEEDNDDAENDDLREEDGD